MYTFKNEEEAIQKLTKIKIEEKKDIKLLKDLILSSMALHMVIVNDSYNRQKYIRHGEKIRLFFLKYFKIKYFTIPSKGEIWDKLNIHALLNFEIIAKEFEKNNLIEFKNIKSSFLNQL